METLQYIASESAKLRWSTEDRKLFDSHVFQVKEKRRSYRLWNIFFIFAQALFFGSLSAGAVSAVLPGDLPKVVGPVLGLLAPATFPVLLAALFGYTRAKGEYQDAKSFCFGYMGTVEYHCLEEARPQVMGAPPEERGPAPPVPPPPPQSPPPGLQSAIPNPQSPIRNPQSAVPPGEPLAPPP